MVIKGLDGLLGYPNRFAEKFVSQKQLIKSVSKLRSASYILIYIVLVINFVLSCMLDKLDLLKYADHFDIF